MSQRPKRMLAALGATLVALCASVALATPALADQLPFGCLVFSSTDEIDDIVTMADGVVTVAGGTDQTAITVTQDDSATVSTDVTKIVIGNGTTDFKGTITFQGIASDIVANAPHVLSIVVGNATAGGTVTIDGCRLLGSESGEPTVMVSAESNVSLTIDDSTIQGPAGIDGSQEAAGPGISIAAESTLTITGDVRVTGGTGGAAADSTKAPGAGGFGIYAPTATLRMTNGTLTAEAGATGTGSEIEPTSLPVGLTVGALNLSNGTGENGQGPTITATGWPQETSKPLPVEGIEAGNPNDDDFNPWVLQASNDISGKEPFIEDYAGSGNTEDIQRAGWQWFNIAPQVVTGLQAVPTSTAGDASPEFMQQVNPLSAGPSRLKFALGVAPLFQNLADVPVYRAIAGATVEQASFSPESALEPSTETGLYFVAPAFTGNTVTVSGSVTGLPSAFSTLNPGVAISVNTEVPVVRVEVIYRLYNQYDHIHLYTKDIVEVEDCVKLGWTNEGEYWAAPADASGGDYVICRLRNPFNGDHYYIEKTNTGGIAYLKSLGWEEDSEVSSFLSQQSDVGMPIFTLFNPFSDVDTHLYTPYENEASTLVGQGWEPNDTIIYALPIVFLQSSD